MKKGDWYKHLFGQVSKGIENEYFFEASFICYGIIEDRLDSMIRQLGLAPISGVAKKIKAISKIHSTKLEAAFFLDNWDGGKYRNMGLLANIAAWGILYRNPMQHLLGDPRYYKAQVGDFHTAFTKELAEQGQKVARELSSAVMRYKKK